MNFTNAFNQSRASNNSVLMENKNVINRKSNVSPMISNKKYSNNNIGNGKMRQEDFDISRFNWKLKKWKWIWTKVNVIVWLFICVNVLFCFKENWYQFLKNNWDSSKLLLLIFLHHYLLVFVISIIWRILWNEII